MLRKILFFVMFTSSVSTFAQKGLIKGTVKDKKTGEDAIGATVVIEGTNIGSTTDVEGKFSIPIDPGTYNITVTYIGFTAFKFESLSVAANEEVSLAVQLEDDSKQLQEIVIQGKADKTSENVLLVERKFSTQLTQSIGAIELSKVGASDASQGLMKVVGLSVQGSKFVVVRGLGDRYNTSSLNSLPVASPNPDRRVLPYDIFPSDVIQNLDVVKSFTPGLYGDFTGANIDIKTKDYPEERLLEIGFNAGMNSNTTFKDFLSDPERQADVFGFNKTREIPAEIEKDNGFTTQGRNDFNETNYFKTKWDPIKKQAPLNYGFNITTGDLIKGNISKFGYLINANYSQANLYQPGTEILLQSANSSKFDFDVDTYTFSTNTSAIGNFYFSINPKNTIRFNNLYTHLSENWVREGKGTFFDNQRGDFTYNRRVTYQDYELLANQLFGEHRITNKLEVKWGVSLSTASSTEPDRRQLGFDYDEGSLENGSAFLRVNDFSENQRIFIDFDDKDLAGDLAIKYTIKSIGSDDEKNSIFSVKPGLSFRSKNREQRITRFNHGPVDGYDLAYPGGSDVYKTDDFFNIDRLNSQEYVVQKFVAQGDGYDASLKIIAPYLTLQAQPIVNKLNIELGGRVELAEQVVDNFTFFDVTEAKLESSDFIPTVTAKYNLNDQNIIRLSGSQTISRPDFKELAPFQYQRFFGGFTERGNPDVKNGTSLNLDLRYEKYTANKGLISIGGYAKQLKDAIMPIVVIGGGTLFLIPINAGEASVYGIEFESRQNLSFISSLLNNWSLNVNGTLMTTNVTINEQDASDQVGGVSVTISSFDRPLVGASPYLINTDITYEKLGKKSDFTASLALNTFGRRIFAVGGIQGLGDYYEKPYLTMNLVTAYTFGLDKKWKASFSVKNLLNPTISQEQEILDANGTKVEDKEILSFKRGADVSLGISYRIL